MPFLIETADSKAGVNKTSIKNKEIYYFEIWSKDNL